METRALLWGVQLELRQEGFASGMGQRSNGAAMKDLPSILSTVAFALDIGQRLHGAAMKDVQLKPGLEGFASGMEQRSNGVSMKDVQIISSTVAFALDMGQRSGAKCSAVTLAIRRLFSEGESATSPRCIL